VYRVSDELALVQTVDFFTPIVDDPYLYGAIAAANSLSDVYAMGGKPAFALNIVGFPRKRDGVPLSVLGDILRGGAEKAREAGIAIVGGHSIDDAEPKYGLCVTGYVHPQRIWRNVGAKAGDRLLLTKPIGSGIITTALRAGKAPEEVGGPAIAAMALLNRAAAEAAQALDVHACTDITGFGLLGHLREMLGIGDVGAQLKCEAVPLLPGVREFAEQGFAPGGARRNLEFVMPHLQNAAHLSDTALLILADPQTSGGLLFALSPDQAGALTSALHDAGTICVDLGEIVADKRAQIELRT
jgi:selenide,water dikinase